MHAGSATEAGHVDGVGAQARFDHIYAITIGPNDELYVADQHSVRKVTKDGVVTTVAGSTTSGDTDGAAADARFNTIKGIYLHANGTLYIADAGNGKIKTMNPDGQVETYIASNLNITSSLLQKSPKTHIVRALRAFSTEWVVY